METERDLELQRSFGQRIRQLRRERKMTQEQLSVRIGVTAVSISHLERGVYPPSFGKLPLLAEALGVKEWQLFEGLDSSIMREKD